MKKYLTLIVLLVLVACEPTGTQPASPAAPQNPKQAEPLQKDPEPLDMRGNWKLTKYKCGTTDVMPTYALSLLITDDKMQYVYSLKRIKCEITLDGSIKEKKPSSNPQIIDLEIEMRRDGQSIYPPGCIETIPFGKDDEDSAIWKSKVIMDDHYHIRLEGGVCTMPDKSEHVITMYFVRK